MHDEADASQTLVQAWVGNRPDGTRAVETLWVQQRPGGLLRLVRTPLLALGVARDDVFRIADNGLITEVVERGGFRALQLVSREPWTEAALKSLIDLGKELGGALDAHDDLMAGIANARSIPVPEVLAALERFERRHPLRARWESSTENPFSGE